MTQFQIRFAVEELTSELLLDFGGFCCGEETYHVDLDDFLRDNALEHMALRMNKTFLCYAAYDEDDIAHPVGFFTVSAAHISRADIPSGMGRRNIPYRTIPVLLIGRFAVDRGHARKGHGTRMMARIRDMALSLTIGCRFLALHVESQNTGAIAFYEREGFFFAQGLPPEDGERLMLYDLLASHGK